MKNFGLKETALPALSLFASAGTLVCCALPALMVSLGMGAALAGLVSDYPALIWLSRNKIAVFITAALLIAAAGIMLWRARALPCPPNAAQARACARLRLLSWCIWGFSLLSFATGGFFAFIAPYILEK
jgi:hypothetical protein